MEQNDEIIRSPIKGFEGLYDIDTQGNVWSLERKQPFKGTISIRHGRKMKIHRPTNGYMIVTLYKNGKKHYFLVHRLVAETFLPNPNNLPQVNHKDEDRYNNCVDNLEWCSAKYNTNYGKSKIERSIKQRNDRKKSKQTAMYLPDGTFVDVYPSGNEAARITGFPRQAIHQCCRGLRKQVNGYIFKYFTNIVYE